MHMCAPLKMNKYSWIKHIMPLSLSVTAQGNVLSHVCLLVLLSSYNSLPSLLTLSPFSVCIFSLYFLPLLLVTSLR